MKELFNLQDVLYASKNENYPLELTQKLVNDIYTIKIWSDEDEEISLEEYDAAASGNGYIAVLEGNENNEDMGTLGLPEKLSDMNPEEAKNYWFEGTKWTRLIVIYNDSFSMILWIKNTDEFDSWAILEQDCVRKYENFSPF